MANLLDLTVSPPAPATFSPAPFLESRRGKTPEEVLQILLDTLPTSGAYRPLPYHNAGHGVSISLYLRRLIERHNAYHPDAPLSPAVGRITGLLHDMRFGEPIPDGYFSPEHRSGAEAYRLVRTLGLSEKFAREIERAIYESDSEVSPESKYGQLLRAADIFEAGISKKRYCEGSGKLLEESKILRLESLERADHLPRALQYFGRYLSSMIECTPVAWIERHGRRVSDFHARVLPHIIDDWREVYQPDQTKIHACLDRVALEGCVETISRFTNDLIIGIAEPDQSRGQFFILDNYRREESIQSPVLVMPGSNVATPFRDGDADVVHLSQSDSLALEEAIRVVRPGGMLVLWNCGEGVLAGSITLLQAMHEKNLNFRCYYRERSEDEV